MRVFRVYIALITGLLVWGLINGMTSLAGTHTFVVSQEDLKTSDFSLFSWRLKKVGIDSEYHIRYPESTISFGEHPNNVSTELRFRIDDQRFSYGGTRWIQKTFLAGTYTFHWGSPGTYYCPKIMGGLIGGVPPSIEGILSGSVISKKMADFIAELCAEGAQITVTSGEEKIIRTYYYDRLEEIVTRYGPKVEGPCIWIRKISKKEIIRSEGRIEKKIIEFKLNTENVVDLSIEGINAFINSLCAKEVKVSGGNARKIVLMRLYDNVSIDFCCIQICERKIKIENDNRFILPSYKVTILGADVDGDGKPDLDGYGRPISLKFARIYHYICKRGGQGTTTNLFCTCIS